jgi:hypothetical protein
LGVSLDKSAVFTFSNCWFATASSADGVLVGNCWDTVFNACEFVTNGSSGARLSNTNQRGTKFNACKFLNNNIQNNGSNGLTVDAGVSDWSMTDCTSNNSLFAAAPGQGYGLFVAAGASDRYIVRGNNLNGNATGSASDGGTGTNKKVGGNIGYEPPIIAPTLINSWVNFGGSYVTAGYWKDDNGTVHLQGLIKSGTPIPGLAFTLPVGYRPATWEIFTVASNAALGVVEVQSTGGVNISSGSNVNLSLSGISFKAA